MPIDRDEIKLNLVVIRAIDLEKSVNFYRILGLSFVKHQHGKGSIHFASTLGQVTFEIYPQLTETKPTTDTRLGFQVIDVDAIVMKLQQENFTIVSQPASSEWGRRSIVVDPDGHRVELTQARSQKYLT